MIILLGFPKSGTTSFHNLFKSIGIESYHQNYRRAIIACEIYKNYNRNNMYEQELMHFINCIEKQKQSINPLSDGIKTLKIALAIHKSSKIKRMCIP